MYLVVIIDVYSCFVIGWSLSNKLVTDLCIDTIQKGLSNAQSEIVNSDQGCQFTSDDMVDYSRYLEIQINITRNGDDARKAFTSRVLA